MAALQAVVGAVVEVGEIEIDLAVTEEGGVEIRSNRVGEVVAAAEAEAVAIQDMVADTVSQT